MGEDLERLLLLEFFFPLLVVTFVFESDFFFKFFLLSYHFLYYIPLFFPIPFIYFFFFVFILFKLAVNVDYAIKEGKGQ